MSQPSSLSALVNTAASQGNPIDALRLFLDQQETFETARQIDRLRFAGYVLELSFDAAKIITSDPYKLAVGGIPRGSFLIMTPEDWRTVPLHFTLLRVTGVSPTPLTNQVQQTYFELHKRAMPELDVWTQSELQWGALDCDVLGMFYADPGNSVRLTFSGDVNNVVSAHRYRVYAPDEALLRLIVNGTVRPVEQSQVGVLRTMECQLSAAGVGAPIPAMISMADFKGTRTAMFGKTRLGKSNIVKLIAKGMLDATVGDHSVGQVIFDVNGEYANDNPQDGNRSIRSAYETRCQVYALTRREMTPSRPLRLNFYETPDSSIEVLASMLAQDQQQSIYVRSFAGSKVPSIASVRALAESEKTRAIRKIQMFWAILEKAGFDADEGRLRALGLVSRHAKHFDPHFNATLRTTAYQAVRGIAPPSDPDSLHSLRNELEVMAEFQRSNQSSPALVSSGSGGAIFDSDDLALLNFLTPASGSGPSILRPYRAYHASNAGDLLPEIIELIDGGRTVILDLGNATDAVRRYFADMISRAIFSHQEGKFVTNALGQRFVQLYFEEAHNLFPPDDKDLTGVYARFAKEGAKFHIGMVYSTQSPSTINRDLLAQTENFFVAHLSSQAEAKSLSQIQVAFVGAEPDILRARTPGYVRMLTLSHRFVVPVQAARFEAIAPGTLGN